MNDEEILSHSQAIGVRVWLEGEQVRFAGPASAVAAIQTDLAARKQEIAAYLRAHDPDDCAGALIDPDSGGLYLPWARYMSSDDVRRMRTELVGLIDALAEAEGWPHKTLDDVMARAMRGPLADLVPNLEHFRVRLDAVRTEVDERVRRRATAWCYEGPDARRYCFGCNGECGGTSKSCTRSG